MSGAVAAFMSMIDTSLAYIGQMATTVSSGALVAAAPTGIQAGDLLVAIMTRGYSAVTWTGDTGWTEVLDPGTANFPNNRIAWKIATASEPSTYTFTCSNTSQPGVASIMQFRHATFDVVGTQTTSTGTSVACTSIVPTSQSLLIATIAAYDATTFSGIAGMTSCYNGTVLATFMQAVPASATGTRTGTVAASGGISGFLFSVKSGL